MAVIVNTTLYGKEGSEIVQYNPSTSSEQVSIATEDGSQSNVQEEIVKIRTKIAELQNTGVAFKGAVTKSNPLPTVAYKAGWQYVVQEAGTYAGDVCEVGDFIICIRDYASGSASDDDWAQLQVNIVGAVSGPDVAVTDRVATFSDTSGKHIKDSGFTIGKSVPADAKFTDTTYNPATSQADGLMTAAQYSKLQNIEAGADKTDADNVKAAGAIMKTDTSDSLAQGSTNLYMTATERQKLSGISEGAQPNQNAFSSIQINGSKTIQADSTTDVFKIESGEGITLDTNSTSDGVSIKETYIDTVVVDNLDNVPENLRIGGLIVLKV